MERLSKPMLVEAAVGVVVGVLVGLLLGSVKPSLKGSAVGWVLAIPLGFWVSLLVHELGHVVVGWAVGVRFFGMIVGPVGVRRWGGVWAVKWISNPFQGLAMMWPTAMGAVQRKMWWMVLGGPAASFLLAVGAGIWGWQSVVVGNKGQGVWLAALAVFSGAAMLLSLYPAGGPGGQSDGALLGMLRRGGTEARRWCAVLVLLSQENTRRAREWDGELLGELTGEQNGSWEEAQGQCLAYYRAVDRGEWEEAGRRVDRWAEMGASGGEEVAAEGLAELAWFEAAVRRRESEARSALARIGEGPVAVGSRLRAEAAIAALAGDEEGARRMSREALEALRGEHGGIARCEKEMLAGMSGG